MHLEDGLLQALLRGDHGAVVVAVDHTARPLLLLGTAAVVVLALSAARKGVHRVLGFALPSLRRVLFGTTKRSGGKLLMRVQCASSPSPSLAAGDGEKECVDDDGGDSWTTNYLAGDDSAGACAVGAEMDFAQWPDLPRIATDLKPSSKFRAWAFSEDEKFSNRSAGSAFDRAGDESARSGDGELWEDFGVKSERRESSQLEGEEFLALPEKLGGPHWARFPPCGARLRFGSERRRSAHYDKAGEYCWDAKLNLRLRPALRENVVAGWENRRRREGMEVSPPSNAEHASSRVSSFDVYWESEKALLRSGSDGIVSLWNRRTCMSRTGDGPWRGSPSCLATSRPNAGSEAHTLILTGGGRRSADDLCPVLLSIWDSRVPLPVRLDNDDDDDDRECEGFELVAHGEPDAAVFHDLRMLKSSPVNGLLRADFCGILNSSLWSDEGSEGRDRQCCEGAEDCGEGDSSWVIVEQERQAPTPCVPTTTTTTGILARCLSAVSSALAR